MEILFSPVEKTGRKVLFDILKDKYVQGFDIICFVPQQYTVEMEKVLFNVLEEEVLIRAKVMSLLSFARDFLGKSVLDMGPMGKTFLVRRAFERGMGLYRQDNEESLEERFVSSINEFIHRGGRREELIKTIAEKENTLLSKKLKDFLQVYDLYLEKSQNYRDEQSLYMEIIQKLKDSAAYENTVFFISGFHTFSPLEKEMILQLDKSCKKLYLLLPMTGKAMLQKGKYTPFYLSYKIYDRFKKQVEEVHWVSENSPRALLAQNLFSYENPSEVMDYSIRLLLPATVEEEVEMSAILLRKKWEEGVSFSEMAVNVTDLMVYEPLIRRSFTEQGLPFYIHKRRLLKDTLLGRFFFAGIQMLSQLTEENLMTFLHQPFVDFFEEYRGEFAKKSALRNLSGKALLQLDESGILENEIGIFYEKLQQELKVKEQIRILYEFFAKEERIEKLRARKEEDFDQEWRLFTGLLDEIVSFTGGEKMPFRQLAKDLLKGIAQNSLGMLPPQGEEIVISGMARSNTGAKIQCILGLTEERLRPKDRERGLLTWKEVEESGLSFALEEEDYFEQKIAFYRLFLEGEELYLGAGLDGGKENHAGLPSVMENLMEILPKDRIFEELPEEYKQYSYKNVLLRLTPEEREKISKKQKAFRKTQLSEGILLEKSLSPTAIEDYCRCPYAYYVKRILRPEENSDLALNPLDIGNCIHDLLKGFTENRRENPSFSREKYHRAFFKNWREKFFSSGKNSSRDQFFIQSLEREGEFLMQRLEEMLKNTKFQPAHEELPFGYGGKKQWTIQGQKGEYVLTGRIDRVDLWERKGEKLAIVIDYKTGNKNFNLSSMYYGWDVQLLLYLYVIQELYRGVGAFYLPVKKKYSKDKVEETVRYTGFALDDEEVFLAIEKEKNGNWKDKYTWNKSKNKITRLKMEDLKKWTEKSLIRWVEKMEKGLIPPGKKRIRDAQTTSCTYCPYKGLCGFYDENNPYITLESVTWEDIDETV